MNTNTFICEHCGETFPLDEAFRCGEDLLCRECAGEHSILCDECRQRIYRDDDQGDAYHVLCEDCFEQHYTRCDSCGGLIRSCHAYHPAWNDQTLCENCYDEQEDSSPIHEYNYMPDLVFHGR